MAQHINLELLNNISGQHITVTSSSHLNTDLIVQMKVELKADTKLLTCSVVLRTIYDRDHEL